MSHTLKLEENLFMLKASEVAQGSEISMEI